MKKTFAILCAVLLASCGGMIKNENGSEFITQLDGEPNGCVFLYKLESESSVYDVEDARRYLENRIADQARPGNAYWITSQRTRPNEWVIFGPERTFILTANVYDCPNVRNVHTGYANTAPYMETYSQSYGQAYVAPVQCGGNVYGPCY